MLRDLVGTEPFWRGIRLYYQRHANGVASTADLRRAMEEASGKELGWFFAQWLTRSGVPQVSGSWRYDAAAKQVEVTLDQTQTSGLYQMPIEVGIAVTRTPPTATPVQTIRVMQLGQQHQVFTFPSDSEPSTVTLDPNAWVMMQATWERKQ